MHTKHDDKASHPPGSFWHHCLALVSPAWHNIVEAGSCPGICVATAYLSADAYLLLLPLSCGQTVSTASDKQSNSTSRDLHKGIRQVHGTGGGHLLATTPECEKGTCDWSIMFSIQNSKLPGTSLIYCSNVHAQSASQKPHWYHPKQPHVSQWVPIWP